MPNPSVNRTACKLRLQVRSKGCPKAGVTKAAKAGVRSSFVANASKLDLTPVICCDPSHLQISAFVAGSNERVIFGAFDGNSLVGICGLGREGSLKERHRGFIRSMYVAPEHRGKGIGGKLLAKACEQAATWVALEQLTLAVTAGNESAETLYAKHGFVPCGRAPRALRVGGVYFDEVQMVRRMSAASHITHAK